MKKYLFIFIVGFFCINQANAIPVGFDATNGIWNISATDFSGLTWDDSTLKFESQTADGSGFLLEGYFNWVGSNGAYGRENFTGTLFSDNTIQLSGFELVVPTSGIVTGNYFAILADSGTEIINGSWDGLGIPSDDWSAVLQAGTLPPPGAIPEPGSIFLFGIGMLGLLGLKRKTVG